MSDNKYDNQVLLKKIIDEVPEGIVAVNKHGQVIYANKAAEDLYLRPIPYDRKPEEQNISNVLDTNDTQFDIDDFPLFRSAMYGEKFTKKDLSIVMPDGQRKDVLVNITPMQDDEGNIIGAIGIFQDNTERKRIEAELRASEDKFSKVFYTNPIPTSISKAADRRYTDVNKAFAKYMGYAREEVVGKTVPEINIWANPEQEKQFLTLFRKQGYVSNFEVTNFKKDGSIGYGLLSAALIEVDGEPCVLAGAIDITELKEASLLREVLNNVNTVLLSTLSVDAILRIVLVKGVEVLGADAAILILKEDDHWIEKFSTGLPKNIFVQKKVTDEDAPLAVLAAQTKEIVISENPQTDKRIGSSASVRTLKAKTALAMPIIAKGEAIGAISFAYIKQAKKISKLQIDFMEKFSASVSLALENSRLFEKQKEAINEAHEARQQVIDLLDSISEGFFATDNDWRVTYINKLGTEILGLSKEEILFRDLWNLASKLLNEKFKDICYEAKTSLKPAAFNLHDRQLNKEFEIRINPYSNGTSFFIKTLDNKKV